MVSMNWTTDANPWSADIKNSKQTDFRKYNHVTLFNLLLSLNNLSFVRFMLKNQCFMYIWDTISTFIQAKRVFTGNYQ